MFPGGAETRKEKHTKEYLALGSPFEPMKKNAVKLRALNFFVVLRVSMGVSIGILYLFEGGIEKVEKGNEKTEDKDFGRERALVVLGFGRADSHSKTLEFECVGKFHFK